jgi:SSS family solute:Na+ symporter
MPPIAAKIGMIFFISCYVLSEWVFTVPLHYLHVLAIIFLVTVVLMLIISRFYPNQKPYQLVLNNNIEIVPWHTRHYYHIILIALMALVFFLFSPYVLA